ncbi:N-acetylmuramoyl-L-alanine amidase CwlD [Paenibacillus xylaniclasticus]|uniref:N-acetylmuramoyl-L-alanine amidase CwlD n=1 Tax=Paenibacillus xylaniclasticus TaxID=588083 RepID=UPI000FDBF398|nr:MULTISPECIES: N-acetylmuramoyl-L-alanine amidase CwlD [Paenibacillus]GFN33454.1 germination-specific N-acetylmuramoyl-L-alanine amidase [Paenibacillus curdlanolyticus]
MRRYRNRIVVWLNYKGAVRIAIGALIIIAAAALILNDLPSTRTMSTWSLPLSGKTVVIDAGHGGIDGGAVSKQGDIEKDLNLAIAIYLRDYLQQAGALVVMTREGDYDLAGKDTKAVARRKTEDLVKRAEFIKQAKPHLVISIHMNSIPSPKWSGAQTFFYPSNESNAQIAALIQDEIKNKLATTSRVASVIKNEVYLMKQITDIPMALVEVGFLSNPDEARRLADGNYQRAVAAAIYQGILRFSSGEKLGTASSAAPLS